MGPRDRCEARREAVRSLRYAWEGNDVSGYLAWLSGMSPDYLAHLIDQPTCFMDKTDSYKTEKGETVNVWECSECGETCEEVNGSYEFCPHCGAEVIGDD